MFDRILQLVQCRKENVGKGECGSEACEDASSCDSFDGWHHMTLRYSEKILNGASLGIGVKSEPVSLRHI